MAAIGDDPLRALYLLLLGTGLRRGEALALRWDDLDLDDGSLRVRARCRASAGVAQQRDAADRLAEVLGWS